MADLGGAQISALLESVPGIANVLRSPVADALISTIRAGAGVGPFDYADAEELVQFAVRRGLIGGAEGEQVLEDVRKGGGRAGWAKRAKTAAKKTVAKPAKETAGKTTATRKAVSPKRAKKTSAKKSGAKAAKRPVKRR